MEPLLQTRYNTSLVISPTLEVQAHSVQLQELLVESLAVLVVVQVVHLVQLAILSVVLLAVSVAVQADLWVQLHTSSAVLQVVT